jgi:spore germination protein YaaH
VDYAGVNELVDRVVLELPAPAQPGPLLPRSSAEELVAELLSRVHSWKILLLVPVYALEWEMGETDQKALRLPYQTALSRAFRHGARLARDEQNLAYYHYKKRGIEYHIRLPYHSYMAEMAAVANRYNLAGLVLDALGMEDPRIWQTLNAHFRTASLIISKE